MTKTACLCVYMWFIAHDYCHNHGTSQTSDEEKNDNAFFKCLFANEKVNRNNIFGIFSFLFLPLFLSISQSKHTTDIKTSVLYVGGKPSLITLDYVIKMNNENNEFRLSYYPHKLNVFSQILTDCFGYRMIHNIFGDFKQLDENNNPAFYIHVVEKNWM